MTSPSPAPRDDDRELARLARSGDLAAYASLVDRYRDPVVRFLRLRCGNDADAEDLAQASFIAAYQALSRYDDRHTFRTWIFVIARRRCIDLLRRRRHLEPLDSAPEHAAETPAPAIAEDERENLWMRVRGNLSPAHAEALWLVYHEDLSIEEGARAMGWSRIRFKVTLHRARHRLKLLMNPPGPLAMSLPATESP